MKIDGINNGGFLFPPNTNKVEENTPSAFEKLWDTVEGLNNKQIEANTKIQDVLLGKSDDTHGALIALEKAEIQMQLAVSVRDKLTQGYQQIINMQL